MFPTFPVSIFIVFLCALVLADFFLKAEMKSEMKMRERRNAKERIAPVGGEGGREEEFALVWVDVIQWSLTFSASLQISGK